MTTGKFLFKATLVIAFFKLMSMLLGLVREAVIAGQFGLSEYTDAYFMALKMPTMLHAIIGGALVTVMVPVFTEYVSRGEKEEAWKVFKTVMSVVTLFFVFTSLIGVVAAPLLVKLVAPGFEGLRAALTVEIARIILPLVIFSGLATMFTGLLNANNIFGLPAFSNSVNNVFIILSAFTLGSLYGIHGLALGTVVAMAVMALVQFPALFKTGFTFRLYMNLKHPGVKKVYLLALPSLLGISVNQVNVYVVGVLASWLPEGSVSALNYADRLIQFPLGLFVVALGTAVFPTLSLRAAEGNRESFCGTLFNSLKVIIIGIIPAGVGLMVLSRPIVELVYQRGAFDRQAVELTEPALLFYAIGLVGQAAVILLTRGFYSLQDTRTPVKLALVTVAVNLCLSLLLIGPLLHVGLALANALSNLAFMGLLLWFLGKKTPGLFGGGLVKFTLAALAASGLMALATHVVSGTLAGLLPGKTGLLLQVGLSVSAGIATYLAVIMAMRLEEVRQIWQAVREEIARGLKR